MVGATRLEHATSWSQTTRSTKLNYAPIGFLVWIAGLEPTTLCL